MSDMPKCGCGGEPKRMNASNLAFVVRCGSCGLTTDKERCEDDADHAWTRAMTRASAPAAPPRERIMRALFEAHRGQWGYSRFHESPEVREKAQRNWDTLKERKPEEWTSLEAEADAVVAEWDAAPAQPARGEDGNKIIEGLRDAVEGRIASSTMYVVTTPPAAGAMEALLIEARNQLEYLNEKQEHGSTNGVIVRLNHALDQAALAQAAQPTQAVEEWIKGPIPEDGSVNIADVEVRGIYWPEHAKRGEPMPFNYTHWRLLRKAAPGEG